MIPRNKVFWIGSGLETSLEREFNRRDLDIDTHSLKTLPLNSKEAVEIVSTGLGVIFVHNTQKFSRTLAFLQEVTASPVRYSGVRAAIIVEDTSDIKRIIRKFVGGIDYPDFEEKYNLLFTKLERAGFADFVRYFLLLPAPGRSPNFRLTVGKVTSLSEEEITLLQRSFSEYNHLDIRKITKQGFSANVYFAYPQLTEGAGRGRPQPFLVKFDKKKKVKEELAYYKEYVNSHVPFNLRPNFEEDRCFLEGDKGVLVASYVDRAIPLIEAVERGTGPGAIHCLFEETMDRWIRNSKIEKGSPFEALRKRFKREKFDANRKIIAEAKKLGDVPLPDKLLALLAAIPCRNHLYGTSHGDLHANNVLVKGSDAIIIDFSQCTNGPTLVDFATLDVSLAFHSVPPEDYGKRVKFKKWAQFVSQLYDYEKIVQLPEARESFELFARQWTCIRQIRRYALMEQRDRLEYAICVCTELLRRSAFADDKNIGASIAGRAYFLCAKLAKEVARGVGNS